MKNLILTGFMASGKTTIGTEAAKMLGYAFADTDAMIEKEEQRTINEIFASDGEEYFRNAETNIARKISQISNTVVSTGGGMVMRVENAQLMRKNGIIVFLDTDFEVIAKRLEIAAATRPLANGYDIEALRARYESRLERYRDCDYALHITENDTPFMCAKKLAAIYIGAVR